MTPKSLLLFRRIALIPSPLQEGGNKKKFYCNCQYFLNGIEWQKGYAMQFGLIAVDRTTQARTPKPSLAYLGSYRG